MKEDKKNQFNCAKLLKYQHYFVKLEIFFFAIGFGDL
jgi:hypothetical protein